MTSKFQPGMRMYEVVWERDGEKLFVMIHHAEDDTGAIERAEEILAGTPDMDFDRRGAAVHARLHRLPFLAEDDD
jgi:hypothetical protein